MSSPHNDIVLFHYGTSPYSGKVVWYLALLGIPYAECIQSYILPRPDLTSLGISYRRIPLLSHGRDVYCDSRLILEHLFKLFPTSSNDALASPNTKPSLLSTLLSKWTTDGGIFARAAQSLPPDLIAKDPKFIKDRDGFMGASFTKEGLEKGRPEALVGMREAFDVLEGVLEDGREWIGGKEKTGPGLEDIEAVWLPHWLMNLPGALPPSIFSETHYPHLYAHVSRFIAAITAAKAKAPSPVTLKGPDAVEHIQNAEFRSKVEVDGNDPLMLKQGQEVEVWATDSGFGHKDRGKLVGLDRREVVIELEGEKGIRLHFPRWGFRIKAVQTAAANL